MSKTGRKALSLAEVSEITGIDRTTDKSGDAGRDRS